MRFLLTLTLFFSLTHSYNSYSGAAYQECYEEEHFDHHVGDVECRVYCRVCQGDIDAPKGDCNEYRWFSSNYQDDPGDCKGFVWRYDLIVL